MRYAVVGAGIAGLAAAWELVVRAPDAEVTVVDPAEPGGRIRTTPFAGRMVDEGPDAWLTRVPEAVALCAELGIDDELVAPAAGSSMLWWDGRLRPLPAGLVLGVPGRVSALVRSGILSPGGALRAGADLVKRRTDLPDADGDVSVFDLVAARFGPQVAARLVDPLVGGIHAGRTEALSAAATTPQLLAAARRSRSLLLGLRSGPSPSDAGPMFLTPAAGVGRLVDVLTARLVDAGVTFERRRARRVGPAAGGGVEVDGERVDGAVLAVPAGEAAAVLGTAAPDTAEGLRAVSYASVVLTTLALPDAGLDLPAGVNGFLVPRSEGRLMTACSFASAKWPHWAEPGLTLLRVSAGRHLDTRAMDLDDTTLADRLLGELGEALGRPLPEPSALRVSRWPASFPQYAVGHLARLAALDATLSSEVPGVALAGAATRGSGIPACIGSGRRAATAVAVAALTTGPGPRA